MKLSSLTKIVAAAIIAVPVLVACDSAEERVASHMERGIAYFDSSDYDRARVEFKAALQIKPTIGRAYYYVARIYEEQRLWGDAMRAFSLAVEHEPDHVEANVRLGRYYVLTNQLPKAYERAEHVISVTGGTRAEGYALRAAAALAQENTEAARKDAQHALIIEPGNPTATSVLVGLYRKENELGKAIEVLDRALEKQPTNAALRFTKIGLHLDLDQKHEAEAEAIALVKLAPGVVAHHVKLARMYVDWGRLDDAEAALRDLVKRRPQSADAKLALVDFMVNQRGPDAAKQDLKKFVESSPDESKLHFALAELYRRDGNMEAAAGVLRELAAREETSSKAGRKARAALASLLLSQGKTDAAKGEAETVLKEEPGNTIALIVRSRIALGEERYVDAIQSLRSVIRNDPNSAEAHTLLYESYLARGDKGLAIDSLSDLTRIQPRNVAAWVKLGQLLATENKLDASLNALDEALKRESDNLPALAAKAKVLLLRGDYDHAAMVAERIGKLPKGKAIGLRLEGHAAAGSGQHSKAVEKLNAALEQDPEDWETTGSLVRSLAKTGDLPAATALLRETVARRPEHQGAWLLLGDALSADGEVQKAAAAYEKASEIEPRSVDAYARLTALHLRQGNPEKAVETLGRAVDSNPEHKGLRVSRAIALENAGRYEEAIKSYEDLLADGHRDLVVVNNLAALIADHAYQDDGRLQRAMTEMKPFENSDNPLVIDTIGWLNFRAGNLDEAVALLKRAVALDSDNKLLRDHLDQASIKAGKDGRATEYLAGPDASRPDGDIKMRKNKQ